MICVQAEFRHSFEDDQVEDQGEIVQPQGRNIADAIAAILRNLGCEVEPPTFAGDHGWELMSIKLNGHRLWGQVTGMGESALLLFEDLSPDTGWFRPSRPSAVYKETVRRLADAMNEDARFSEIAWQQLDSNGREVGPVKRF